MAEKVRVKYRLLAFKWGAHCKNQTLAATTDEQAMAAAAAAVLIDPTQEYRLVKTVTRDIGHYTPIAALIEEWEGG